ncbi:MAG TPA: TraE/TraK family type IV conjugative transfer system protein [Planctomycetota bacterium]
MDIGPGRLLRPPLIAGALLGANVLLAAGLVASALAPRRVVVLPSARAEAELWPGVVPDAAVREFALRYVLHFDNYTPATIDAATDTLKRMLSARAWTAASEALDRRRRVAVEGRMASQVLPLTVKVEGARATIDALRRTFVSDRLSREARVAYVVEVEKQPATEPNPFGLAVVSQTLREE